MILLGFLLLGTLHISTALDNGLARTPPMGWLNWERYRCNTDCKNDPYNCISADLFLEMAKLMKYEGYADVGYEYINIDDCWMLRDRGDDGKLVSNPELFPEGIPALADAIHSMGLKIGIYEDYGTKTCGGYPGTKDHIEDDVNLFASWGIDSLKLDGCYCNASEFSTGYPAVTKALNATGRPILYSCSWPAYLHDKPNVPYGDIAENCNLWRNYADIQDSWTSVQNIINWFGDNAGNLASYAGPGNWNDPDMLIIGDYGLSFEQSETQMAMWAMMAAPLYMSNDLRTLRQWQKDILMNQEVIAVDQDPMGKQGVRVYQDAKKKHEYWSRELADGSYAVVMYRRDSSGLPKPYTATFKQLMIKTKTAHVRDLFTHMDLGVYTDGITATLPPSGSCKMFKVTPIKSQF